MYRVKKKRNDGEKVKLLVSRGVRNHFLDWEFLLEKKASRVESERREIELDW